MLLFFLEISCSQLNPLVFGLDPSGSEAFNYSPFCLCAGHKSSGSVKLQLEFSAHSNPSMLTVKLVDIVLMSSKAMSLGKHFMCQCVYKAICIMHFVWS